MATYRPKPKAGIVEAFVLKEYTELRGEGGKWLQSGGPGDYLVVTEGGNTIMGKHEFEAEYEPDTNALTHWQSDPGLPAGFRIADTYAEKVK
jgi:hypothetical protein